MCVCVCVCVCVFAQVFDKAFVTLFHITGGDPWPDTLPGFNEDGYLCVCAREFERLRRPRPPAQMALLYRTG